MNTERRQTPPRSDQELYKLPDIHSHIESERRHDELDRLREVREQKKTWRKTVLFCALVNVVLLGLAIWGMYR